MAQILKVKCLICDSSGVAIVRDGETPYCYNCDTPTTILGEG